MENIGKVLRTVALVAVGGLLLMMLVLNVDGEKSAGDKAWDIRTTIGNADAKNHFIMYTDIACPYCDAFSRVVMNNQEKFEQLLADKDILFEIRLTDYLYKYGSKIDMSKWSAEATVCATEKDRFWDYYHAALQALWDDYHSKGIGSSKTAPMITDMTRDYWVKIGEKIGLNKTELSQCMNSEETVATLDKRAERMIKAGANGMPYFVEGSFSTAGFDDSWGWEEVEQYLTAGLKK